MPLPYTLHKNNIRHTGEPENTSYRAVAKNVTYVGIDDAIKALTRPGSILKHTECFAVIHGFLDYLNEQVAEGNGFLSPYFRLTPGLRGVFDGEDDAYDPKRHRPSVNFRPGKKMQQAMRRMKAQRIDSEVPAPHPTTFQDWKSGTENQTITPGHSGVVVGEQLKVVTNHDPEQGVFFVHLPSRQTFRADGIFHNYPRHLLFPIPDDLPAGPYQIEVRSAFGTSPEIRSGRVPFTLTVA